MIIVTEAALKNSKFNFIANCHGLFIFFLSSKLSDKTLEDSTIIQPEHYDFLIV